MWAFAVTLGLDSLVLCHELVLKLAKIELGGLFIAKYGFLLWVLLPHVTRSKLLNKSHSYYSKMIRVIFIRDFGIKFLYQLRDSSPRPSDSNLLAWASAVLIEFLHFSGQPQFPIASYHCPLEDHLEASTGKLD